MIRINLLGVERTRPARRVRHRPAALTLAGVIVALAVLGIGWWFGR